MEKVEVSPEIGRAIMLARKRNRWSQHDLAKQLNWGTQGQTLISRLEKGNTRTDPEKINAILDFLDIRQDAHSAQDEPRVMEVLSVAYRELPLYDLRVSAGFGAYSAGHESILERLQLPRLFLPENGDLGLVRVEGDSMFPTINHGDYVAVEFNSGYTADGLYLIRIEDAVFVKRLQQKFGGLRVISDNRQYEDLLITEATAEDFSLIGRVALIVRKT